MTARSLASALLAAAIVAAVGVLAPRSSAQFAEPYRGTASAELVHLQALNITSIIQVADLVLAPAEVEVASTGLVDGNSRARAANLDLDLVSQTVDDSLLVEVEHLAPGDVPGPVAETFPLERVKAAGRLRHGTVNINEVPGYRIECSPFGGVKDSGLGIKEGVIEAIKSMTTVKTFSLPW
jgi:hypothetical protein